MGGIDERGSLTARAVAAGRTLGVGDVRDEVGGIALGGVLGRLVDGAQRLPDPLRRAAQLATVGLAGHATLRMRAMDAAIARTVDRREVAQVVVVGAGYDTRAWRLEALRGLPVHELDLPATQAGKAARLRDVPTVAGSVHLHPVDLGATGLAAALEREARRDGFDRSRPTLWVWEAVAMYLPEDAVTATLQDLGEASAPGSTLLMTQLFRPVLPLPGGGRGRRVDRAAMRSFRLVGEPLLSSWDVPEAEAALGAAGFRLDAITTPDDWRRTTGPPEARSTFPSEHLVEATRVADRVNAG